MLSAGSTPVSPSPPKAPRRSHSNAAHGADVIGYNFTGIQPSRHRRGWRNELQLSNQVDQAALLEAFQGVVSDVKLCAHWGYDAAGRAR